MVCGILVPQPGIEPEPPAVEVRSLSFIHSFIYLYFWLHWVFVAACRLSLVAASGGYFLLWLAGSRAQAQ